MTKYVTNTTDRVQMDAWNIIRNRFVKVYWYGVYIPYMKDFIVYSNEKMGCILRNYWQTSLHNEHVFRYLPLLFIYSCTYINGVLQQMRPNVIFFMYNCTTFKKRYVDKIYVLIFKYKWRSSDRLIFVSYM